MVQKSCSSLIWDISHYLQGFIHPGGSPDFFHQQYVTWLLLHCYVSLPAATEMWFIKFFVAPNLDSILDIAVRSRSFPSNHFYWKIRSRSESAKTETIISHIYMWKKKQLHVKLKHLASYISSYILPPHQSQSRTDRFLTKHPLTGRSLSHRFHSDMSPLPLWAWPGDWMVWFCLLVGDVCPHPGWDINNNNIMK